MRTLIYVPIIHASADLGSIGKEVAKKGKTGLGEELWQIHTKTVDRFWETVARFVAALGAQNLKIYQDGMVADGDIGRAIVGEVVKTGSKNYEIIAGLLQRGAELVKTEDLDLVKEERDRILRITGAKSTAAKLAGFVKYRLTKNSLLKKRDLFIAKQINETLRDRETGILFVGAYHSVKEYLDKDIDCREVKEIEKVRQYHKLLLFAGRDLKRFKDLADYLVRDIESGRGSGLEI